MGLMSLEINSLLVLSLAAWRVSIMLADDSEGGPWDILTRFRLWVGVHYDDMGEPHGTTMLSRMVLCHRCNSFWIGAIFVLLWVLLPYNILVFMMLPFAFSGAVMIIEEYIG